MSQPGPSVPTEAALQIPLHFSVCMHGMYVHMCVVRYTCVPVRGGRGGYQVLPVVIPSFVNKLKNYLLSGSGGAQL